MSFLCGKNPDPGSNPGNDDLEIDEQPTQPFPRPAPGYDPEAFVQTWPDLRAVQAMMRQARTTYAERERRARSLEFCPVCWRYKLACGIEDSNIYLYPRLCDDHAHAVAAASPAERVIFHQQVVDALQWYLWPPGFREHVDRLLGADDDGSSLDGDA